MPKMGDLAAQDTYGDVDWSRMNQPFGELLDPNPKLYNTKAGPIYQGDINQAIDVAMGVSGGGLATKGIKAYHSSPHDFDKFDLAKIGTGEGAQAYGHGLYFAENPAVSGLGGQYWNQFLPRTADMTERNAARTLQLNKFDRDAAIADVQANIAATQQALKSGEYPRPAKYGPSRNLYESHLRNYQSELKHLESGKPVGPRTYEVNIKADPAHMLDWDKPIREQSHVLNAVQPPERYKTARSLLDFLGETKVSPSSGATFNKLDAVAADRAASAALREANMPGIKYLDQGSRAGIPPMQAMLKTVELQDALAVAKNPAQRTAIEAELAALEQAMKPTSNYVVFDPSIIDIMKKYGIAGAAPTAMGALAAQDAYRSE